MESAGKKYNGRRRAEHVTPEKAPADEAVLRETADMISSVGTRVKELAETLARLGNSCEQTAEFTRELGDVRGRSFATRYAAQELAEAVHTLQTETERTLFALKSVKLGKTLKELHALAAWTAQEASLASRHIPLEQGGMTVKHEVWLVRDGRAFGKEAVELLRRIEEAGSLKGAVAGMKTCFVTASRMVRDMERRLGFPLLERKIGGASRGGSRLTPEARDLMKRYEALSQDAEAVIHKIYAKHFG
jgi:molybdate transport system regulatory protein